MSVKFKDYSDAKSVIGWFDVDPTFDPSWRNWMTTRVYAFVPELHDCVEELSAFSELAELANVTIKSEKGNLGILKDERLTVDQIKVAAGLKKDEVTNRPRPVRVDKALLICFAANTALVNSGKNPRDFTIFLSAFNLSGLHKWFNSLEKGEKEALVSELSRHLEQKSELVSDFMRGSKVTFGTVAHAYKFFSKAKRGYAADLPLKDLIETPSQKHKPSSLYEDFSVARLDEIPPGF